MQGRYPDIWCSNQTPGRSCVPLTRGLRIPCGILVGPCGCWARLCLQGSLGLEWSGRGLFPRSGPGSLLPYVPQSQVPCDWIGAGAVFHSPEVLGSRGESCVGPCGCWARLVWFCFLFVFVFDSSLQEVSLWLTTSLLCAYDEAKQLLISFEVCVWY